jgi:hypothetical protein
MYGPLCHAPIQLARRGSTPFPPLYLAWHGLRVLGLYLPRICIFYCHDYFVPCTFLISLLKRSLLYCHTSLSRFSSFIAMHVGLFHSSRACSCHLDYHGSTMFTLGLCSDSACRMRLSTTTQTPLCPACRLSDLPPILQNMPLSFSDMCVFGSDCVLLLCRDICRPVVMCGIACNGNITPAKQSLPRSENGQAPLPGRSPCA